MTSAATLYDRIAGMILAMEAGAVSAAQLQAFAQAHFGDPQPLALELRTWSLARLRQHLNPRLQDLDHEATVRAFVLELAKRLAPVFGIAGRSGPYLVEDDPYALQPVLLAIADATDASIADYAHELRTFRAEMRRYRTAMMQHLDQHHAPQDPSLPVGCPPGDAEGRRSNRLPHRGLSTALVDQVIRHAEVAHTHRVLVPHAGTGCLATGARQRQPALIHCFEADPSSRQLLISSGFDLIGFDFLSEPPGSLRYDRVIAQVTDRSDRMIGLLRHAYGYLAEGGRLAVLVSFTQFDAQLSGPAVDWIASVGGECFDGDPPDHAQVADGAKRVLVVIDRSPGSSPAAALP